MTVLVFEHDALTVATTSWSLGSGDLTKPGVTIYYQWRPNPAGVMGDTGGIRRVHLPTVPGNALINGLLRTGQPFLDLRPYQQQPTPPAATP